MKSTLIIVLCLSIALFSACTQSSNSSSNNAALSAEATKNIAVAGNWSVSYFFDNTNETSHFSGYTFTFNAGGTATAVKTGNTVSGTWSTITNDNAVKFNLDFGIASPFDEIADDWQVITANSGEIRLADVSGGKGDTDYLTFTKN